MISYINVGKYEISVGMNGKKIGSIMKCISGWQYRPLGRKWAEHNFSTLEDCKRFVESDLD